LRKETFDYLLCKVQFVSKISSLSILLLLCVHLNSSCKGHEKLPKQVEQAEPSQKSSTLTMKCEYADYDSFQHEVISIGESGENPGQTASVMAFKRGGKQQAEKSFLIRPGQFAECVYPSGTRVRVKVGEGTARPYGMCGGDPEIFMSLWVNERKIVSRLSFGGHCRDEEGRPAVSFQVSGGDLTSIRKCHSVRQRAPATTPGNGTSEPLSVCIDFPDISRFPHDYLEYPQQGTKKHQMGDIESVRDSAAVCKAVLDELKNDFSAFGNSYDPNKIRLSRPDWLARSLCKLA
jgi:hypothetical protein